MWEPHRQSVLRNSYWTTLPDRANWTPRTPRRDIPARDKVDYQPLQERHLSVLLPRQKIRTPISAKPPLPPPPWSDVSKAVSLVIERLGSRDQGVYKLHSQGPRRTAKKAWEDSVPQRGQTAETSAQNGSSAPLKEGDQSGVSPFHWIWEDFSVDEYVPKTKSPQESEDERPPGDVPRKVKRKRRPKRKKNFTTPEPFQMTLKDEQRERERKRERSALQPTQSEPEISSGIIRANPMPRSTTVPLYQRLLEESQHRRTAQRQERRDFLLKTQKPFTFAEREEPRRDREEEIPEQSRHHRRRRWSMKEILEKSSQLSSARPLQRSESEFWDPDVTFRPHIHENVPDFPRLHRKFQEKLDEVRSEKVPTVPRPFRLHVTRSTRERILEGLRQDRERERQERQRRDRRSRKKEPESRKVTWDLPVRLTRSALLRDAIIRQRLEDWEDWQKAQREWRHWERQRLEPMQKRVASEVCASQPRDSLALACQRKREHHREQERVRSREYSAQLSEIQERVNRRPLLLEGVTQMNRGLALERNFRKILEDLGLEEEEVLPWQRSVEAY
ncbi:protein FAM161B-like [Acipenser oxyrinchus oxyrinchus]|uniref:Protein FAM161B-like n=1 Tax=Acipenser oxyrinchus oxyrinchus TaxID=40147 RepID=A0AAD8FT77_ACIOX|nr:protein FAM161B-like [Acipenser oxyrinchus oxyrinchus]